MDFPSRDIMKELLERYGWMSYWSDDNWIKKDYPYTNPDIAGISMEAAYTSAVETRRQEMFDVFYKEK